MITQPETPWAEGYTAGTIEQRECPYPPCTPQHWAWISGWIEGRSKPDELAL